MRVMDTKETRGGDVSLGRECDEKGLAGRKRGRGLEM